MRYLCGWKSVLALAAGLAVLGGGIAPAAAYTGTAAGYTVTDSDETSGGPVLGWDNISATGTQVNWANGVGDPIGDESQETITLPFTFTFMGTPYTSVSICSNGFIEFGGTSVTGANVPLPDAAAPNATVYAFWDDLIASGGSDCRYATLGSALNRRFVVSWIAFDTAYPEVGVTRAYTFQIALYEQNGGIRIQYLTMNDDFATRPLAAGQSATIGIENSAGTSALQYLFGDSGSPAVLTPAGNGVKDGLAIGFLPSGNTPPWTVTAPPPPPPPSTPHTGTGDTTHPCSNAAPASGGGPLWPAAVLAALLAACARRRFFS